MAPPSTPPSTPTNTPAAPAPAAAIRPAASLLVLSPTNRLLLLKRSTHLSFGSAHVFPGGVLAPHDHGSTRLCALRETFEETGILLTTSAPPASTGPLTEIQRRVHAGELDFVAWVRSWGGTLVADEALLPFTTWITPPAMKKRYASEMFVTTLPEWISEDAAVAGDGGREVVGAPRWITAAEAMREAHEGQVVLYPPQCYLLHQVARLFGDGGEQGRERLWKWAKEEASQWVCEPIREAVTESGHWIMGLGARGDRNALVLLEVASSKGAEPRAIEVLERTTMKERLGKL